MGQLIWFCLMSRSWFRHLNSWSNCLLHRKKISTFFSKSQHLKKDCCDLTKKSDDLAHYSSIYWWQISSFSSSTPLGPRDEIWVVFVPSHHIVHVYGTQQKGWQRVTIVIWALQHVSNIETPISLLRDISLAHLFSLYLKVSSLYRKKK